MKISEAIMKLKEIKTYNTGDYAEALDMAINALELQQAMDECENCKI